MDERDTMRMLQSDVVIPQIVQQKADAVFEKIRKSNTDTENGRRKLRMRKRGITILVAATVLALGGITVLAAYQNWSRSLSEDLQISEEQKETLQEIGRASCRERV